MDVCGLPPAVLNTAGCASPTVL